MKYVCEKSLADSPQGAFETDHIPGHLCTIVAVELVEENFTPTNTQSKKLPADIVESFHNILRNKCGSLWSNERHVMDVVAAFISR
jgi:hypothetical protein